MTSKLMGRTVLTFGFKLLYVSLWNAKWSSYDLSKSRNAGKNVPQVMYKRQFLEKILSNGLKSNCIIKLPYSKCDCMHLCDLFYAKFINSFYALSLSHVSWTNSGINVFYLFFIALGHISSKNKIFLVSVIDPM